MNLFKGVSLNTVLYSAIGVLVIFLLGVTATHHLNIYTFSDLEKEFGMEISDVNNLTVNKETLSVAIPKGNVFKFNYDFHVVVDEILVKNGQQISKDDILYKLDSTSLIEELTKQQVIVNNIYKKRLLINNSIEIVLGNIGVVENKLKISSNKKIDNLNYEFILNEYKMKVNDIEVELVDLNAAYHKEKKKHSLLKSLSENPVKKSSFNGFVSFITNQKHINNNEAILEIENTENRTLIFKNTYEDLNIQYKEKDIASNITNNRNVVILGNDFQDIASGNEINFDLVYSYKVINKTSGNKEKNYFQYIELLNTILLSFIFIYFIISKKRSKNEKIKNKKHDDLVNLLNEKSSLCFKLNLLSKEHYIAIQELNKKDQDKIKALIKELSLKIYKERTKNNLQ